MAPLLTFIDTFKAWHVLVVGALALVLAGMIYFSTSLESPAVMRVQLSLHSAVALPVMLFALALLIFAVTNRKFGALALI